MFVTGGRNDGEERGRKGISSADNAGSEISRGVGWAARKKEELAKLLL